MFNFKPRIIPSIVTEKSRKSYTLRIPGIKIDFRTSDFETEGWSSSATTHNKNLPLNYFMSRNTKRHFYYVIKTYKSNIGYISVDRESSVGIATRYGPDGPRTESRCGRDFPHPYRRFLIPTHPPV
jgi:hypothetical protein